MELLNASLCGVELVPCHQRLSNSGEASELRAQEGIIASVMWGGPSAHAKHGTLTGPW